MQISQRKGEGKFFAKHEQPRMACALIHSKSAQHGTKEHASWQCRGKPQPPTTPRPNVPPCSPLLSSLSAVAHPLPPISNISSLPLRYVLSAGLCVCVWFVFVAVCGRPSCVCVCVCVCVCELFLLCVCVLLFVRACHCVMMGVGCTHHGH